ncbi:MAG: LytR C-terminal domain-containing protein [Acidimicrobiales bacterium]
MNEGAGRGLILVAVAVAIGIVLLAAGLDDSASVTVRASDDTSDSNTAADDDDESTVETVPNAEDVNPADVPVVVANGSGLEGAAGAVTEQLAGLGYDPGSAVDVSADAGETLLDTVYYITAPTSFEAQALKVAADLGLGPDAVMAMPVPPPAEIGLAGVLVVLGSQPAGLAEIATSGTATTVPTTVPAG